MKHRALFVAGGLALSLSLSACGAGDEAQAAEAISASMLEDSDDELSVDEEQADCVGEGLVDEIGIDQLQDYGMLTDDLEVNESVGEVTMEEADADSAAEVIIGCVDAQTMLTEQMGADGSMTEEQQECMSEALDDEALTEMFSLLFQGKEDEATDLLLGPAMSCLLG
jgi:hypothetical protein